MKRATTHALRGKKVFVGLSGGVDSGVTAALLQEMGADVTAVFIKGWYPPGMPCTWAEDRRDAMRVAAHLRLPFNTLDASEEYRTGVIDYLLREYKAGRTPNPDIMCNREVKFGAFYNFARAQGADFIATGHYAQRIETDDEYALARGIDEEKDQSYFLWAIPSTVLSHTLFPLGGMQKSEVRARARAYKLPNARKRDSQGICFLGNISIEDFLSAEFGSEPGVAVDSTGKKVGMHSGAILSTLGQRIALAEAEPGPWFVVGKDMRTNTLVVSHEKIAAEQTSPKLVEVNWLSKPQADRAYTAQYRYHGPRVPGTLNEEFSIFTPSTLITEPVAAGQSLVIYDDEKCLGGGIIA